ncbi:hypothetical protein K1719_027412 [Acacia pycnantha]|nr:hypothetical protein K1719_027412 [Acacia pycnantha]
MITMDVKGITWVANIYQKFENMCLEAEEMIHEEMHTVGEGVKKFYDDVMEDLLPPSCDLDEREMADFIDQDPILDAHNTIIFHKERPQKLDIKQRKDLRMNHEADKDVTCAASYETEIGTCRTLSSNVMNENHEVPLCPAATISNQSLAEVRMSDLVSDCCGENDSSEEIPGLPIFDNEPADEKEMNVSSSSSGLQSGEVNDGWNFEFDFMTENDPEAMGKGGELKLDQSCVMVSEDELRSIPMAGDNPKANKKKMRRVFSFGRKCGRKQEYEQLVAWHEKREEGKGDCVEDSEAACESDWEVL